MLAEAGTLKLAARVPAHVGMARMVNSGPRTPTKNSVAVSLDGSCPEEMVPAAYSGMSARFSGVVVLPGA